MCGMRMLHGDNVDNPCEAISDYIEDKNIYKCKFESNICKKRKECSDFDVEASCKINTGRFIKKMCLYYYKQFGQML